MLRDKMSHWHVQNDHDSGPTKANEMTQDDIENTNQAKINCSEWWPAGEKKPKSCVEEHHQN